MKVPMSMSHQVMIISLLLLTRQNCQKLSVFKSYQKSQKYLKLKGFINDINIIPEYFFKHLIVADWLVNIDYTLYLIRVYQFLVDFCRSMKLYPRATTHYPTISTGWLPLSVSAWYYSLFNALTCDNGRKTASAS